jgi:hypothetical protein
MIISYYVGYHRGVGVSIGTALALLAWDAVLTGSFLMSLIICPIWFFLSIVKNMNQPSRWKLALVRITIPALTLGLVLSNNAAQSRRAEANAANIIRACEEFHAANDKYPKTLGELVPQYMSSVPRAKYCLLFGDFLYWNFDSQPMLAWYAIPPYGCKIYNFEERRWSYLD